MKYASESATVTGILLGVAGFALSIFNFLRDQAKLHVGLVLPPYFPSFSVEIANIGRRSAFVRSAGLRFRDKRLSKWNELARKDINRSLSEGDASISESFMFKDLHHFREHSELQAFAVDLKGKMFLSKTTLKNHQFPGAKLNKKA